MIRRAHPPVSAPARASRDRRNMYGLKIATNINLNTPTLTVKA